MGLDMYLKKKTYIGGNYEFNKISGEISILKDGVKLDIPLNKVTEIVEEAGYWRKANAIHRWFVENVQDGEDDCKEYELSKEKLIELRELCLKVIETKDASLLPPQEGFFFGSTKVDNYYFEDLKNTVEIINDLKIVPSNTRKFVQEEAPKELVPVYYTYQASW